MGKLIQLPESFVRRFDVYPAPESPRQSVTEVDVIKPSPLDNMEEDDEVQYIGRIYKARVLRDHPDVTVYDFVDLRSIV
jgi:hypothetical protein